MTAPDPALTAVAGLGRSVTELLAAVDRLTEQLEDARRWAAFLVLENTAAAALHYTIGDGDCDTCVGTPWPCATARALGAEPAPAPADSPCGDASHDYDDPAKWSDDGLPAGHPDHASGYHTWPPAPADPQDGACAMCRGLGGWRGYSLRGNPNEEWEACPRCNGSGADPAPAPADPKDAP